MNRCKDGCKYNTIRWEKNYCDKKCEFIKNSGLFCKEFKPDNWWSKLIKKLGL